MNPISLLIQRKTKVPTKYQQVHLYRSDWRKIVKISYSESEQLFKNISGIGFIETDAQFCKWLFDNFGKGIYFLTAWRRGHKGFWSFMKVELKEEGFRRLPKNITKDELEKKREIEEMKGLKNKLSSASKEEIVEIKEDIEISEDVIGMIKDDIKEEKKHKRGCYPYLKSTQPIYSFHSYEDYTQEKNNEDFIGRMV